MKSTVLGSFSALDPKGSINSPEESIHPENVEPTSNDVAAPKEKKKKGVRS